MKLPRGFWCPGRVSIDLQFLPFSTALHKTVTHYRLPCVPERLPENGKKFFC
jgi:hypothetical protein